MIASSLRWIVPGLLAGSAQPGLLADLEPDLETLRKLGIRHVVSLTEERPVLPPHDEPFGHLHFPVYDMGIPQPRKTAEVCAWITERMDAGEAVLVHCRAGLGRTGMLLACCLVWRGEAAAEAIRRVRSLNPGFIQNKLQEDFVSTFEAFLQDERAGGRAPGS